MKAKEAVYPILIHILMHSNSSRLVRAVEKCQNLYSCIGGGRGAQNISTKQYWFRQYKVTSNSFKTHPLQK